jgi:hypothetical protein
MGKWVDPPALATTNGTKPKPCDLGRERPHDQARTMIRHTGFGPTQPIVAVTYPVRPPAGVRLLITAIGQPSLPLPRCSSTVRTAVAMPTIAMTADAKNSPAAATTSRSENEFGEHYSSRRMKITTDDGMIRGAFGTDDGVILVIRHCPENYVFR